MGDSMARSRPIDQLGVDTLSGMSASLVPALVTEAAPLTRLRLQVREWLELQVAQGVFEPRVDNWLTTWDRSFSQALAEQGWVGMTIPREYGGQGRSHLERFVVSEELLAAGAPCGSHWIADRQVAPSLLAHGTEAQRRAFLPGIAAGRTAFAIGMSEPGSGSDLASVRTRAERVDAPQAADAARDVDAAGPGWRLTGTKVWTSGAHEADYFIALARTAPVDPTRRHDGLTSFIVDLRDPKVHIAPILSTGGRHHFNEVHLDGVWVPDSLVLGQPGQGWVMVTAELGYERSGPERALSTWPLLAEAAGAMSDGSLPADGRLGRLLARVTALHHMSFSVSSALEAGEPADVAAATVKDLGTVLEGDIVDLVDSLYSTGWANDERLHDYLATALLHRPGFTLRGGTNEILRGVVARGLGVR